REQPPVERARERDDLTLFRPLPRELEGALVRLGPRVTEEHLPTERLGQFSGKAFARLGAVEVRDVDEPRVESAHDRFADDGAVVAEGVDGDSRDEVEIAGAVFGDQLRAFPRHEQGADSRIHAQQRRSVQLNGGHAGWVAGGVARRRVPAVALANMSRSPMRTARTPAPSAWAAARSFAAMPSVAMPDSIIDSTSAAASVGCATPSISTPGMSEAKSNSSACK